MNARLSARRTAVIVVLAALVAGSATWFGFAFADQEHGHADAEGVTSAHAAHQDAAGREDAGAGAVASAIVIGLLGGALAPGSVLLAKRGGNGARTERPAGAETLPVTLAALSTGAAAIHFAVVAEHLNEWWLTGAFFVAVALLQLGWAVAALLRPSSRLYAIGAAANALVVLTWIVSRTSGVPVGPEAGEREPVGFVDLVATGYEALIVALAMAYLRRRRRGRVGPAPDAPSWFSGAVVVSLTALALALLP